MARIFIAAALAFGLGGPAAAEVFDVQMLNIGSDGERMVFEPALVRAQPGDTIRFVATDRSHNAETLTEMIPDGAEAFSGAINEEIEVTLEARGLYAVICKPHFALGMVMIITVGEVEVPDGYLKGRIPPRARERFETQLGDI